MSTNYYGKEIENTSIKEDDNVSGSKNKVVIIVIIVLAIIFAILLFLVFKISSKGKDKYTLTISPDTIVIPYGENKTIAYDVRKNGVIIPDAVINLTIADENIAKANDTTIYAVNYGKTTVKAVYKEAENNLCEVVKDVIVGDGDLSVSITNVIFSDGDIQMKVNETYNLQYEIVPSNGFIEKKDIKSSNTSIVTVDNTGLIKAIGVGSAIISIDINNGKFKKTYNVYVSSDNNESSNTGYPTSGVPTSINIINSNSSLKVGETLSLSYNILPSNAQTSYVTWYSSDNSVLSVDNNGTVTAVKEGTAVITVEAFNGVSDSITIQVNPKVASTPATCGILCTNPKYNGSFQNIATCSAGCTLVGGNQKEVGVYDVYCSGAGFSDSPTVPCEIGSNATAAPAAPVCCPNGGVHSGDYCYYNRKTNCLENCCKNVGWWLSNYGECYVSRYNDSC